MRVFYFRFAEYLHKSIRSVLRNVEVLCAALPQVIASSDDYNVHTRANAKFILDTVSDPSLIAQMMLIDRVYEQIERIEKEAQSSSFGAFDYVRIISLLRRWLEVDLREADESVLDVVTSGCFRYDISSKRNKHTAVVNLHDTETKKLHHAQRLAQQESIRVNYERWLGTLVEEFGNYVEVISELQTGIGAFTLSEERSLDERVDSLRSFLSTVNTDFEPCGAFCQGIDSCACLANQMETFLKNVQSQLDVRHWKVKVSSEPGLNFDYSAIFAYYLADENDSLRQELRITNILRALEMLQLMKASQSATERAFSVIGKVVSNRYENKYRIDPRKDPIDVNREADENSLPRSNDFVEAAAFISMNTNVVIMDAALARDKFIASNHEHAFLKTKPRHHVGKAVSTITEALRKSLMERKRSGSNIKNLHEKRSGSNIKNLHENKRPCLQDRHDMVVENTDVLEVAAEETVATNLEALRKSSMERKQSGSNIENLHEKQSGSNIKNLHEKQSGSNIENLHEKQSGSNIKNLHENKRPCVQDRHDIVVENTDVLEVAAEETVATNLVKERSVKSTLAEERAVESNLEEERPVESNAAEERPVQSNPTQERPVQSNPTEERPGKSNAAEMNRNRKIESVTNVSYQDDFTPALLLRTNYLLNICDKNSLLTENSELQQNIVSAFLSCYREDHIIVFSDGDWKNISKGVYPAEKIDWTRAEKVLVGIHDGRRKHFVLYYFEMSSHKFYFIDTVRPVEAARQKECQDVLIIWHKYLDVAFPQHKIFDVGKASHAFQIDATSCGVLVCKMAECIATDIPLSAIKSDGRSITRYRREVWQRLYENRDKERCATCRDVIDKDNHTGMKDRWIECTNCKLWHHFSCAGFPYHQCDRELNEETVNELAWRCQFCER